MTNAEARRLAKLRQIDPNRKPGELLAEVIQECGWRETSTERPEEMNKAADALQPARDAGTHIILAMQFPKPKSLTRKDILRLNWQEHWGHSEEVIDLALDLMEKACWIVEDEDEPSRFRPTQHLVKMMEV